MSRPLVFRLPGAADVVIYVRGCLAWVLDRSEGIERWLPLVDPPLVTCGVVLTRRQAEALLGRVGMPN